MPEIYRSSVLKVSSDRVWDVVRDFNNLPAWHPAVAESRIEGGAPSDQIGCVRAFRLNDGGFIRERLLAMSDYDLSCTYAILESPMGVENYVATVKLTPITDGAQTFIEWSAEFNCDPGREDELIALIGDDVFQGAFNALKERFGG